MDFNFSGSFDVPHQPDAVYEFLADPHKFAPLLPDFESVEKTGEGLYTVKLSVGVSHIRGTALVRLKLAESDPPLHAAYEGKGDLPGGTTALRAAFDLEPSAGGTRVNWTGRAMIAGRLPSLAGGLLEPLAKKNLSRLIDGLKAALS
jgi:carbon monoxide dehydrogenase subunit G